MKLWWYSAGNILYALDSLGYLAINITNLINQQTFEYLATYIIFIIDALLYTADWYEQRTIKKRRELIGCILNIIGSVLYLIGATIASITTNSLNTIIDFIFIIIRLIQIGGDVIYTIDAVLYIIFWIKANEQMRKVGVVWLEKGNMTFNQIMKKKKPNVITTESTIENLLEPIIENIESITECPSNVETLI